MKHTVNFDSKSRYSRPIKKGFSKYLHNQRLYFTYREQINWIRKNLKQVSNPDYKYKVLDIGCGSGEFLSTLMTKVDDNIEMIGLELDYRLISEAKARCPFTNIQFVEASAESLPFENQTIDCITTFHNIEHLYNPDRFIEEAFRCLKKNGILILATPNPTSWAAKILNQKWHSFTLEDHVSLRGHEEWKQSFETVGFQTIYHGTTFFSGFPWIRKSPLQLINLSCLVCFGSLKWSGGESLHAVYSKIN